jgi:sensor c-di-GMP phosphodiesterase-like protein
MQGYLFSKPLPFEQLTALLQNRKGTALVEGDAGPFRRIV